MSNRRDEDLLQDAGGGDREAFGVLVERHHRAVMQFVHRFLGDIGRDTAEDLAQDVFLKAWKAASSFEPRAQAITWLLRIATNTCLNYRRGKRLRRAVSLDANTEADIPDRQAGPAAASQAREQADRVRRAIAELPPNQRAAIVLRHFHGLSYAEISDVLDVSVSAVESLLFRARRTLRVALAENETAPQVLPGLGAESL